MQHFNPYTSGVGHKVHIAAMAVGSGLRNGQGLVALCGVSQRVGGSWEPGITDATPSCPECRATATQMGIDPDTLTTAAAPKSGAKKATEPSWFSATVELRDGEVVAAASINQSYAIDVKVRWGL